jgi:hypothetical protein
VAFVAGGGVHASPHDGRRSTVTRRASV